MIWDLIRDFYVTWIFGGVASDGTWYVGFFGYLYDSSFEGSDFDTATPIFNVGDYYISVSEWLSNTATIVTMIMFVVLLFMLATWLFKLFRGLFSLGK